MINKIKACLLFMLIIMMLSGCNQNTNGIPSYFIEPDGYVIATVYGTDRGLFSTYFYGYISQEDYQSYLDGTLNKPLVILNPYVEGREVNLSPNTIGSIEIGEYKDYRQLCY